MTPKQRRETLQKISEIPNHEPLILLATGKYIGEGFDFPRLDTLLLTMPISWKGKVAQYAGRLHREYPGKQSVCIYDYADILVPVLERMYQKRLKSYLSIAYQVQTIEAPEKHENILFTRRNFLPVYQADLESAFEEVLICSPFLHKNRIFQVLPLVKNLQLRGLRITVITRNIAEFPEKIPIGHTGSPDTSSRKRGCDS